MAVDDLWYLKKRGPDGGRLPSKRHGRGRRWRVRWVDPLTGKPRYELFDKKSEADLADSNRKADISRGLYIDPKSGKVTVAEYIRGWKSTLLIKDSSAERFESAIRLHVIPTIGALSMSVVRSSHIKEWIRDRMAAGLEPATIHLIYGGILAPMFTSAVVDRVIGTTPCTGITLPTVEATEHYIPTPEQVHGLYRALSPGYRAITYMAAACGLRGGEIMGLERECVDMELRKVHVRQQLKTVTGRRPFLAEPKTKTSTRTVEMPDIVAEALTNHMAAKPVVQWELDDETGKRPVRRTANLLFTTNDSTPVQRSVWSRNWRPAVAKAGLPEGFGLHGLRHYYATVLIFGGANVKTVQLKMGHKNPTITLNTYLGYWPDAVDQTQLLLDAALGTSTGVALASAA